MFEKGNDGDGPFMEFAKRDGTPVLRLTGWKFWCALLAFTWFLSLGIVADLALIVAGVRWLLG